MDRSKFLKRFLCTATRFFFSKSNEHAFRKPSQQFHALLLSTSNNTRNRKKSNLSFKRPPPFYRNSSQNNSRRATNYNRNGYEIPWKAADNYSRRAFAEMSNSSSGDEEEETEVLPEWVEVPAHCALQVQKICTALSFKSPQDKNYDLILRPFRDRLNSDLVLGVLRNYRRIGKQSTLQFFSWAGRQRDYQHSHAVVDYMADFLGRRKLFDELKRLLKEMSASGLNLVTSRTASIAVRFLGRAGRIQEALWVFDEMEKEFNCRPDNLVSNNLLYVLCKCSAVEEGDLVACVEKGLLVFRKMECPDSFSYSNVIIGLCKIGRVEQALEIFEEMCRNGVRPTRSALNNLIGKLCDANKKNPFIQHVKVLGSLDILVPNLSNNNHLESAKEVFSKVGELGLFPSAFVVKMFIDEVTGCGKVEEALKFFNLVLDRGLRQDEETHHIILQALVNLGRIEEARQIFSKMIAEGLKPKIFTYNLVISALCKIGHLNDAEEYFYLMKKKQIPPNNVIYTALIHGHCKAENWQAAAAWMDELLGLGWCPHSPTFDLVDSLLRKTDKHDLADKLWQKMECLRIHKDCKSGKCEAAYQKVCKMLEGGFPPQVYTLDLVDRALRKAGKWEMAHELLQKADRVMAE